MNKFADAILRGEELTASGEEGINGLTISNAAFLSSWLGKTVTLPIDEDLFYSMLQDKINNSTFKKTVNGTVLSGTYTIGKHFVLEISQKNVQNGINQL